jgi:SulP family sulfate permease
MNTIFIPKLFTILQAGLDRKQVLQDVFSGIVVGIVALPLAIAFAVASGVSPEKGLITSVVAGFFISFLGGSRVQIGGPTGAFIVIVFGIVEQYGIDGLVISTILAGICLVLFGLLKLGTLLKFFPHPLIVGFTSGIALIIFSTQIKDAFGLPLEKVPSEFYEKWVVYLSNIHNINWLAASLAVATIFITIFSKKITTNIPGSFLSILILTPLVKVLHLEVATIETFFGSIPNHFELSLPAIHLNELRYYLAPAITIALLGGIESLLSAVVADGMISGRHRSNTELIAQGIANIVTPFFGGIPATGAIARTATNVKNGGRTPISGIVHALTLLLIMLFLGQWAKLIPMSCLAGILIVVAYNMSEWRSFAAILKGSYFDILILLSTFFITVFFDLTLAIEVGVVLSAVLFMKRMADVSEKRMGNIVDSDVIENYSNLPRQIAIYEISGPFFFASARRYSEAIEEIGVKCRVLIIRMRHVSFIDQTGLHNLKDTIHILKKRRITVLLSGVNAEVMGDFKTYGLHELISDDSIFDTFDHAMIKAYEQIESPAGKRE